MFTNNPTLIWLGALPLRDYGYGRNLPYHPCGLIGALVKGGDQARAGLVITVGASQRQDCCRISVVRNDPPQKLSFLKGS